MTFEDFLASDMMSRVNAVPIQEIILGVVLSFLVGMFIYFVYKKTFNGVMYSSNFGVSLVGMCMIATVLIMAVSSNVVLSLGMVGALSIVRFRTAIKEPMDILYLFWAISAGIILATGMIPLAVCGSLAVGIALLILANRKGKDYPYMLIVTLADESAEDKVMKIISSSTSKHAVKSKTFSKTNGEELTVEVRLKKGDSAFVRKIYETSGVANTVMVSYNGDYMT